MEMALLHGEWVNQTVITLKTAWHINGRILPLSGRTRVVATLVEVVVIITHTPMVLNISFVKKRK